MSCDDRQSAGTQATPQSHVGVECRHPCHCGPSHVVHCVSAHSLSVLSALCCPSLNTVHSSPPLAYNKSHSSILAISTYPTCSCTIQHLLPHLTLSNNHPPFNIQRAHLASNIHVCPLALTRAHHASSRSMQNRFGFVKATLSANCMFCCFRSVRSWAMIFFFNCAP